MNFLQSSIRAWIIFFGSVFSVGAHADVAPYVIPFVSNVSPVKEKETDVRMVEETVILDLYPTFMRVHVEFILEAGNNPVDSAFLAGFPEKVAGFRGVPLDALSILVDGQPVKINPNVQVGRSVEFWWTFPMTFEPGQKRSVTVKYIQAFTGVSEEHVSFNKFGVVDSLKKYFTIQAGYIFRTGRLWKGNIDKADVRINLHGIEPSQVRTRFEKGQPEDLRWTLTNWEPDGNLGIEVMIPLTQIMTARSGRTAYDLSGESEKIRLLDRIIRFGRAYSNSEEGERNMPSVGEWEELIENCIKAAQQEKDDDLRSFSRTILADFRQNIVNAASPNQDVAVMAWTLDWLNPDPGQSTEEMKTLNSLIMKGPEKTQRRSDSNFTLLSKELKLRREGLVRFELCGFFPPAYFEPEVILSIAADKMRTRRFILWGSLLAGIILIVGGLIVKKRKQNVTT